MKRKKNYVLIVVSQYFKNLTDPFMPHTPIQKKRESFEETSLNSLSHSLHWKDMDPINSNSKKNLLSR